MYGSLGGVAAMKDMQAQLEKLRTDAAECALIRDLATDIKKRELFTKLAEHLATLAAEVENAVAGAVGAAREDGGTAWPPVGTCAAQGHCHLDQRLSGGRRPRPEPPSQVV